MVKIVCWNINRSLDAYPKLQEMDADVALLQEVGPCAAAQMEGALDGNAHWDWETHGRWPAVLKLSNRVKVRWFRPISLVAKEEKKNQIAVSDLPTLAAACVTPVADGKPSGESFIVMSMYARGYRPHPLAREKTPVRKPGTAEIKKYADASAHRIISDLSGFIAHTNPANHRIIAAGDLNTIYDATKEHPYETPERMRTIFNRMRAIGLEFLGPRAPKGGRKADPTPQGLRPNTRNVPTYLSPQQMKDMKKNGVLSGNQLDYVFASRGFHERVSVRALNAPNEWGPSDHCRIVIEAG